METLALVMLGVAVGALGTLVGVGGGFIIVPVLLAFMPGLGHAQVVAVSLVTVAANGISGSIGFLRQRPMPIAVRPAVVIALATLPGAVAGPMLVRAIDARTFAVGLACVMLLAAVMLLVVGGKAGLAKRERRRRDRLEAQGHDEATVSRLMARAPTLSGREWAMMIGISLLVGFVATMMGIGGGLFHVPALVFLMAFPVRSATGTSVCVLAVTALAGTATNIAGGTLEGVWDVAAALGVGAVIGAQIGARLSRFTPGSLVMRVLAVCLVAVAVRILIAS
jgi:uncharacterized membrane protein YfcA